MSGQAHLRDDRQAGLIREDGHERRKPTGLQGVTNIQVSLNSVGVARPPKAAPENA